MNEYERTLASVKQEFTNAIFEKFLYFRFNFIDSLI